MSETTTKKTTTKATQTTKQTVEPTVDEQTTETREVKKYKMTDPVECMSITTGMLGMEGIKSHINYTWANRGDVTEVEYQDVVAAIRSNASFITKPYFIIKDEDFLLQFPKVADSYSALYSIKDLKDVFKQSPATMKATIMSLPEGAKNSIKNLASTEINNGNLDSVKKIKILDEIFDTKLMLLTELFD